jgi:hypothetical protein
MDISPKPSPDEARFSERKLYRAGQTQTASKAPGAPLKTLKKSSTPANSQSSPGKRRLLMVLLLGFGYYLLYGTAVQRKRVLIGLGVAAWLLMLGSISYCVCLPDLSKIQEEQTAIWQDPNLTFEEKREKTREIQANLTREERRKVFEIGMKERMRKGNSEMSKFLKMSPKEQIADLKKKDEESKQRRQQWAAMRGNGGPSGGGGPGGRGAGGAGGGGRGPSGSIGGAGGGGAAGGGGTGGGIAAGNRSGGGGGGGGGGGWGGGGWGGGGPGGGGRGGDPNVRGRMFMDSMSPEARAGRAYQSGLRQQLGLGGGGWGGFGGGRPAPAR